MDRLYSLADEIIAEYRDEYGDLPHITDVAHEIADGLVPVYDYDIMALAMDDIDLALNVPELGPAGDGTPTAINLIAANIYELLFDYVTERLWEEEEED